MSWDYEIIRTTPTAEVVEVEADQVQVREDGALLFRVGADLVMAFALGEWAWFQRLEPKTD